MGCSEGKQKTYHLAPYYKAYSFDEYILRELDLNDLKNDYFFNLLRQQYDIPVGTERDDYEKRLQEIKKKPDLHLILVWIDTEEGNIIGTGTLIIERKFSHNLGKIGRIEDVIIDSPYTSKGLDSKMVQVLSRIAFQEIKVYKVILETKEKFSQAFEKINFKPAEKQMVLYDTSFYDRLIYEPSVDKNQSMKSPDLELKNIDSPQVLSK